MIESPLPHFKQPLLKTPFHERARALSQVDSFIPWSGYSTVDVFSTVEQEYFAMLRVTSRSRKRVASGPVIRYFTIGIRS